MPPEGQKKTVRIQAVIASAAAVDKNRCLSIEALATVHVTSVSTILQQDLGQEKKKVC